MDKLNFFLLLFYLCEYGFVLYSINLNKKKVKENCNISWILSIYYINNHNNHNKERKKERRNG
jgi:hypothetical protein